MSCYYGSSLRSKRLQSSYCAKVRAFPSPFLVIHFFFRSCPSFLDEPRKETLATQASMVATFLDHNSGELQRQRQRRQRERQKGNRFIIGSLSNNVFERRTSTGSGLFSFFDGGFGQIFSQIASKSVKKLRNTNFISSRHVKWENITLSVDVRCSKTSLLKLPVNKTTTLPMHHTFFYIS